MKNNKKIIVAGVDEVGRGPLAGPVVTAAVILDYPIEGLNDSKKLTPKKREQLALIIQESALCFAYGRAEVEEIDRLNIHHATLLAMQRAIEGLSLHPELVMVDGLYAPKMGIAMQTVVNGDSLIPEISAASILAKVSRDREMQELDLLYPGYSLGDHKGYPTPKHREALLRLGPSPIHRKSYAPVAELLAMQAVE